MAFLFRKAKAQPVVTPNDIISRLRDTQDLLEKRERYLQKKSENELMEAKRLATKNKRAALFSLKKKKVYDSQIDKLQGARMTLETQLLHIEQATVTKEAFSAITQGAQVMKEMHGHMTVEDVEETMDNIREQMDVSNEISDAISQPVGFGIDIDEDELEAELAELAQQQVDESLLGVQGTVPLEPLPAVPAGVPDAPVRAAPARVAVAAGGPAPASRAKSAADDDEEQLRRLEAEMS